MSSYSLIEHFSGSLSTYQLYELVNVDCSGRLKKAE